jgi:hypothetical protein
MFNIVASDEHQLPLPVEAEGVDQAEPRLAGPSARDAQPMSESQPVEDREHDKGGNTTSRKESDLKDPIVRERKLIQPLHAQSKTSAAKRMTSRSSNSPAERWFSLRPRSKTGRRLSDPGLARRLRAPNLIDARDVTFHNKMRSR